MSNWEPRTVTGTARALEAPHTDAANIATRIDFMAGSLMPRPEDPDFETDCHKNTGYTSGPWQPFPLI
ncbi:hypothetical protein RA210_U100080 [Rubrivivax sp. A210]|nr:hypothetical protein RA210_U100080 [Rubrivivax sp. A210]